MRSHLVVATLLLAPQLGSAAPYRVDYAVDGSITGVAFAGTAALMLIDVEPDGLWERELLPFDEGVKANFSSRAASLSDMTVVLTVATPVVLQLAGGVDDRLGEATLIYGEAIGLSSLLNAVGKYTVQRPRPYAYNPDPRVAAWAEQQGSDAYISFYSGHASTAFASAVAGSLLFAYGSDDSTARAVVWGLELALAATTANLRVRAGKHFYSDVLLGALIGASIGFTVPYLHRDDGVRYDPKPAEWAAMAGGLLAGIVGSQLMPLSNDVAVDLTASPRVSVLPMPLDGGAGLALSLTL